jgi:hypothetical protein
MGRHDDAAAVFHFVAIVIDIHLAAARFEPEELVAVLMHLGADLLARLQRHQHQLQVMAGVEHLPKVSIAGGLPFDIVVIAFHLPSSFVGSCPQFISE